MKKRNYRVGLLAASSLVLASCAPAAGTTLTAPSPPPVSATQPAPDVAGAGAGHAINQSHTESPASVAPAGEGPSAAALMVCGKETQGNLASMLALKSAPHAATSWADRLFTCTYDLAEGPLVLSVKESADPAAARKYFDGLRAALAKTAPITGLANLGFPAYQTKDGTVVFLKDNMTLHVNATDLAAAVGPHKVTRTALAYQISTTVLACWTE